MVGASGHDLGAVLQDSGPGEARHWWERRLTLATPMPQPISRHSFHDSDPNDARE